MDSHLSSSSTAFDQDPVIPTILYVVIGYLIGRLFLSVFRLACDTSMQCFIMAEDKTADQWQS